MLPGGADVGEALVTDPNVAMISFTGSAGVGRRIGELAGKHLKKVSLELGGSNSLIVLDDADLDLAASNIAWGAWLHQGQICMASNRVLVHEAIADAITERLVAKATHLPVGDGATGQVALGPLIDATPARPRARHRAGQRAGRAPGWWPAARYDGLFYKPTVLAGVKPGMRSFDDETFGPVVNLVTFKTDDEAVALANNSQRRPGGGGDLALGGRARWRSANRLRAGMVHVNDQTVNDDAHQPVRRPRHRRQRQLARRARPTGRCSRTWQWVTVKDTPPQFPF